MNNRKRILLIGGGGFIGHHLACKLKDYDIFVLDNFIVNNMIEHLGNYRYIDFLQQRYKLLEQNTKKIYKVDARDYHKVSIVVDDCKPDVIIHLAAISHANKSNKNPYKTFDHSLGTLEVALDSTRANTISVKHFIYFSSSMVYGDFTEGYVTESSELKPKGIYGTLKLCGENIVKSYNEVYGIPYTIVRPSALYGPRCVSRRVIQAFIENCLDGKMLSVNGDGNDRLDFTYINDLVRGIDKIIKHFEKSKNEIFNITYGAGYSINDVIDLLRISFKNIRVDYKERDKLMPKRGMLSIDKAKKKLRYYPQYRISKGLDKYIKWYMQGE